MSSVVGIASGPLALQLALTGIEVIEVEDAHEAEQSLEGLLAGDVGLIVVDDRFQHGFSKGFRDRLDRHSGPPLVLYCPEFDREAAGTDAYIASVLRPAVGYEIRLDE